MSQAEASQKLSREYSKFCQLNRGDYIVVNTARNQLFSISNSQVVLEATCWTRRAQEMANALDSRQSVADLARGEFRITSKIRNPALRRPDWAFIDGGQRLPSGMNHRSEESVLSDYSLGFGNKYFIYGSFYAALMGKNLTGCIRLRDHDLEKLFVRTRVGTPILIF